MFVYEEDHDELLKEIKKELAVIKEEDPVLFVTDRNLKLKIAKYVLEVMDRTPRERDMIVNVADMITNNFIWFNFEDELNEVFEDLEELELPEDEVEGNSIDIFEELIERLKKYLG